MPRPRRFLGPTIHGNRSHSASAAGPRDFTLSRAPSSICSVFGHLPDNLDQFLSLCVELNGWRWFTSNAEAAGV